MRRWLLAIGVLLGGGLSVAHAEYLRIIYDLSGANKSQEAKDQTGENPLQPGRPGLPAPRGMQPPGQNPGRRQPGQQPRGPQNPGIPGNPGVPGGPNGPGGTLPPWISGMFASNVENNEPLRAEVVVEYTKASAPTGRESVKLRGERGPQGYPTIHHRWGKTGIAPNLRDIHVEFVKENGVYLPPVERRYKNLREEKLKGQKTPDAATLLELADWALTHYLVKEFEGVIEEIRAVDSKNPAVEAFDYYTAEMKKQPRASENESLWRSRITNNKVKQTEHYTLLYSSKDDEPEEVRDYARRLEDNYRAFFYWFALKADALKRRLKVPETRLVAVLLDKSTEFESYREAFDNAPVGGDGFFSRRENLAVFSTHRLDETFALLEQSMKPLWQTGWNQDDLLKGGGHIGSQPDEIIHNQMLALLLRAMQDESALATVSHVASQQLVVATGLLPRNVEVPEWIEFGMGSFFETPKGAFWPGVGAPSWRYLVKFKVWRKAEKDSEPEADDKEKDKDKDGTEPPKPGPKPSPGPTPNPRSPNPPGQNPRGPNPPGARRVATTPLDPATEAIRFVITDKYFRDLRDEQRREDRRQAQGNSRALATKAETMAWGLTYFLMSRKSDSLMRYFDELNKLPRDIDFDDDTLLLTFGRAFDMVSETNTGVPILDNSKLDKLAEEWYSFLDYTNIESSEAMQDAVKDYQKRAKKKPASTNQPKKSWKDYLPKAPPPRPRR